MNRYYYDLHVHSCLSPCGDNDMTVNNIAGMAALKGLNIVALTDHNSSKNCPSFFDACKKQGIIPIAGMEMTTAEEIHMVVLFEELEKAMRFDEKFSDFRMKIKNKPQIFGEQYILDSDDNIIGNEEFLLPPASSLSLCDACDLVKKYGGICYPAHIDRPSGGIIEILGDIPDEPDFGVVEYSKIADISEMKKKYPKLKNKTFVKNSDAHYLWDISEKENFIELDDEPYSSAKVRNSLFAYLRGKSL